MGLDLSRIEAWTREMLEAEARKRRIRSPEFRTRSELVRLILKHQYGARFNAAREGVAKGRRAVEQTRDLMNEVVSTTLSLIPSPFRAFKRLRGDSDRPTTDPPEWARSEPPSWSTMPPQEQAAATTAAPPPAAPAAAQSVRTFVEEPIRTHSMARVLASQGHGVRALAIYEELLAHNSHDEQLRREAAAVRNGQPIEPPELPDPGEVLANWRGRLPGIL